MLGFPSLCYEKSKKLQGFVYVCMRRGTFQWLASKELTSIYIENRCQCKYYYQGSKLLGVTTN